jgi:uncharacterized protein involved in type VI secretion and phage assembly
MIVQTHADRTLADATGRIYGVVVGVVTKNDDPDKLGRVKVELPWLGDKVETDWARTAVAMAGKGRGLFYLPEVGDEVLVAFEHGDVGYPYVLGGLWNGKDAPPATNADGKNNLRVIQSRSGMTFVFDDTSGSEKLTIADTEGKESIEIDMANKKITITSSGDLDINAADGKVTITGKTVKIESTGAAELKASDTLDVGGKTVNVKGQPNVNIN